MDTKRIALQWNLASSRFHFRGFRASRVLKNIQKLKISKNIKLKLEISFKDELQMIGFKA